MKRNIFTTLVMAATLVCVAHFMSGCASSSESSASAPQTAGGAMTFRKAENLDRVWLADGFNFTGYDALVIAPIGTQNINPKDDKEAERLSLAQAALAHDFMLALQTRRLYPSVVLKESEVKPGAKALKLENTIVKFSRGSSALRYGVGFGAGAPYIRIQGQMTELGSAKPLFIYELDETGDWAFSGFTSSRTLQTQAASELAEDVATFMTRVAKGDKIKYR